VHAVPGERRALLHTGTFSICNSAGSTGDWTLCVLTFVLFERGLAPVIVRWWVDQKGWHSSSRQFWCTSASSTGEVEEGVSGGVIGQAIGGTKTQNDLSSWFNDLVKISSGTTRLSVNYMTSVAALGLGILLSILTLGVI